LPIGLAIGVLSALTGIGGGAIMVPVMQLGFAAPAAMAKGTSLLVITPTSILGGARALRKGNGSLRASLWIGCSGVLATV
ncbi:sulfite exporter TauE/SafE family protein, partial [Actinoalloteichus caeruleus]